MGTYVYIIQEGIPTLHRTGVSRIPVPLSEIIGVYLYNQYFQKITILLGRIRIPMQGNELFSFPSSAKTEYGVEFRELMQDVSNLGREIWAVSITRFLSRTVLKLKNGEAKKIFALPS